VVFGRNVNETRGHRCYHDPVGGLDDVYVVFDDHHGAAVVDLALEHLQQLADVREVEAGGRLVTDVMCLVAPPHEIFMAIRPNRNLTPSGAF